MRSYDSPGNVITFDVPEADFDLYSTADLNVAIGDFAGVTEAPVDTMDGKLNVAVEGVYERQVQSTAAAGNGAKVYLKADGTLTTTAGGNTPFGRLIGAIAAGQTADVRVKLLG